MVRDLPVSKKMGEMAASASDFRDFRLLCAAGVDSVFKGNKLG